VTLGSRALYRGDRDGVLVAGINWARLGVGGVWGVGVTGPRVVRHRRGPPQGRVVQEAPDVGPGTRWPESERVNRPGRECCGELDRVPEAGHLATKSAGERRQCKQPVWPTQACGWGG
jgi:hypothetical protein